VQQNLYYEPGISAYGNEANVPIVTTTEYVPVIPTFISAGYFTELYYQGASTSTCTGQAYEVTWTPLTGCATLNGTSVSASCVGPTSSATYYYGGPGCSGSPQQTQTYSWYGCGGTQGPVAITQTCSPASQYGVVSSNPFRWVDTNWVNMTSRRSLRSLPSIAGPHAVHSDFHIAKKSFTTRKGKQSESFFPASAPQATIVNQPINVPLTGLSGWFSISSYNTTGCEGTPIQVKYYPTNVCVVQGKTSSFVYSKINSTAGGTYTFKSQYCTGVATFSESTYTPLICTPDDSLNPDTGIRGIIREYNGGAQTLFPQSGSYTGDFYGSSNCAGNNILTWTPFPASVCTPSSIFNPPTGNEFNIAASIKTEASTATPGITTITYYNTTNCGAGTDFLTFTTTQNANCQLLFNTPAHAYSVYHSYAVQSVNQTSFTAGAAFGIALFLFLATVCGFTVIYNRQALSSLVGGEKPESKPASEGTEMR